VSEVSFVMLFLVFVRIWIMVVVSVFFMKEFQEKEYEEKFEVMMKMFCDG